MVLIDPDTFAIETREKVDALEAADTRWRPMATAPIGRVIEILLQRDFPTGAAFKSEFIEIEEGDEVHGALYWREAHPDWQEVGCPGQRRWESGH